MLVLETKAAHVGSLFALGALLGRIFLAKGTPRRLVAAPSSSRRIARVTGDESFKFLTYQLSTVGYWPTVALTGNGELGFDSGEGA